MAIVVQNRGGPSAANAGRIIRALLATVTFTAACFSAEHSQPKSVPGKSPIAVFNPAELGDDLDFAIQGEYAGHDVGAQVIALGDAKFEVKLFRGGLPGDGWDKSAPTIEKAVRVSGRVELKTLGVLSPGKDAKQRIFTLTGKESAVLKKVERKSPTLGESPPKSAVKLFAGPDDARLWDGAKIAELSDGMVLAAGCRTKQKFQSLRLHVEFRNPWMPGTANQTNRGAGVFLQDRYEIQVLDNFGADVASKSSGVYTDHNLIFSAEAAAKQDVSVTRAIDGLDILMGAPNGERVSFLDSPKDLENMFVRNTRGELIPYTSFTKLESTAREPKVNMCFPPMVWQTYDIEFTAAEVDKSGEKKKSAKASVRHNGIVIYDGVELNWNTPGGGSFNRKLTESGAVYLQSHGAPVVFRNIWAVAK